MTAPLDGRTAVITGAGRGIGRAVATELARAGATVALVARSADQLDATAALVHKLGGRALSMPTDLADPTDVEGLLDRLAREAGDVDILINNAGVVQPLGSSLDVSPGEWAHSLMVNVVAVARLSSALAAGMVARGWGRIVNVSSGVVGRPGSMIGGNAYVTGKAAIEAHTVNLAAELAGTQVTVNAYRPGSVDTAMQESIRERAGSRRSAATTTLPPRSRGTVSPVTPQTGIFALGTPEHCYLELDLFPDVAPERLVRAVAGLSGPLSTTGGVNTVVGFRPELWAEVAPGEAPPDAASFTEAIQGPGGFAMPATQHDAWVWVAGGDRTAVFDNSRAVIDMLRDVAGVAGETTGWLYQHDRDLTGFIDGTKNPTLLAAPGIAAVPAGPGAGSSIVLFQLWRHDSHGWDSLGVRGQELAMGRTKADSVEFDEDDMPPSAHVARTTLEVDGEEKKIFRRNVAYGGVTEHGTVFVGFACERFRLHEMLRRMAGATDRIRDGLTHWLVPLTGAYYTVPSVESLARYAPPAED